MTPKYEPGKNPNSLKNLKRTAGPGRSRMTTEEKFIKKAIRDYMKEYLENGEAVKDFEKVRVRKPEVALNEAMDRIYGKVSQPAPQSGSPNVALLIQVLCGHDPQDAKVKVIEDSESPDSLIQTTDCTLNAEQENAKFRR
jgi:hypothetical protein